MKQTLVVVAAHADDAEFCAGGTMAKWAAGGGEVHIIMTTNNCSGLLIPEDGDESLAAPHDPKTTFDVRRREQDAAAAMIGAKVHYLDYCQRHYWDGERYVNIGFTPAPPYPPGIPEAPPLVTAAEEVEHIDAFAERLVRLRPALALTHTPVDFNPEHHATAFLVWHAFRRHRGRLKGVELRFWRYRDAGPDSPILGGIEDHIEDISGFYEKKMQMCAAHASQFSSHRRRRADRYARACGGRVGVQHGEAFTKANIPQLPAQ